MQKFERYPLEIVKLTSTHIVGPETHLLERVWTNHSAGVIQGERGWDGACLFIVPQLNPHVLEFTLVNERVSSLHLWVGLFLLFVFMSQRAVPGFLGLLWNNGVPSRNIIK